MHLDVAMFEQVEVQMLTGRRFQDLQIDWTWKEERIEDNTQSEEVICSEDSLY